MAAPPPLSLKTRGGGGGLGGVAYKDRARPPPRGSHLLKSHPEEDSEERQYPNHQQSVTLHIHVHDAVPRLAVSRPLLLGLQLRGTAPAVHTARRLAGALEVCVQLDTRR